MGYAEGEMSKRTDQQIEERVITLYAQGVSLEKIGELVGASKTTCGNILRRCGVGIKRARWLGKFTEGQTAEVIQLYRSGETQDQIAERFGTYRRQVALTLKRAGIPLRVAEDAHRRIPLWEEAFETLTPEAAYWLGFLMADGNVCNLEG